MKTLLLAAALLVGQSQDDAERQRVPWIGRPRVLERVRPAGPEEEELYKLIQLVREERLKFVHPRDPALLRLEAKIGDVLRKIAGTRNYPETPLGRFLRVGVLP